MSKMETNVETLSVNGVEYVRKDQAQPALLPGKRAVVVVDRGWIFAGDVDDTSQPGRILISRALHVFSWASVGFAGMIADPKKAKADLRKCADVNIPADCEIFRVSVPDSWGM